MIYLGKNSNKRLIIDLCKRYYDVLYPKICKEKGIKYKYNPLRRHNKNLTKGKLSLYEPHCEELSKEKEEKKMKPYCPKNPLKGILKKRDKKAEEKKQEKLADQAFTKKDKEFLNKECKKSKNFNKKSGGYCSD